MQCTKLLEAIRDNAGVVRPDKFIHFMQRVRQRFGKEQHDAQEFLAWTLGVLRTDTSITTDMFQGAYQSEVACSSCNHAASTTDVYMCVFCLRLGGRTRKLTLSLVHGAATCVLQFLKPRMYACLCIGSRLAWLMDSM